MTACWSECTRTSIESNPTFIKSYSSLPLERTWLFYMSFISSHGQPYHLMLHYKLGFVSCHEMSCELIIQKYCFRRVQFQSQILDEVSCLFSCNISSMLRSLFAHSWDPLWFSEHWTCLNNSSSRTLCCSNTSQMKGRDAWIWQRGSTQPCLQLSGSNLYRTFFVWRHLISELHLQHWHWKYWVLLISYFQLV